MSFEGFKAPKEKAPKIVFTPEQRKQLIGKFYETIIQKMEMNGGKIFEDIKKFYSSLPTTENYILRREDTNKLESLADGNDMPLALDAELGAYANAVSWSKNEGARGITNAFQEGMANFHGLATVIGFVKGDDLEATEVPNFTGQYIPIDRSLVKSVRGIVHPEDVRFVIFRAPTISFPEDLLTEEEEDETEEKGVINIFRAAYFPHGITTAQQEAAE